MNENEIDDETFNGIKMFAVGIIAVVVVFSSFVAACLILLFR